MGGHDQSFPPRLSILGSEVESLALLTAAVTWFLVACTCLGAHPSVVPGFWVGVSNGGQRRLFVKAPSPARKVEFASLFKQFV